VSLYVRKSDRDAYKDADIPALLAGGSEFQLGVIPGRLFQDPALNESIRQAEQAGRVKYAQSDEENLKNLVSGEIDGFIGDRMGVTAAALELGHKYKAVEIAMPGISGVHFIFSKKTVPAQTVEKINGAITMLEQDGVLKKRLHTRIFSVIMGYALDSQTFFILSVVGTIAFALSGVLIAYRENFSFFGALVLAALPAVGGGALRDILFDRHPLGIMTNPLSLYLVGATVLTGFCVAAAVRLASARPGGQAKPPKTRRWLTMANTQEVCDAAGMAAFTVSGLAIAITVGPDPLWVWGPISAMLTAAGGGILRDIVRQAGKVGALKDEFYAEVPLLWGLAFSVFLLTRPNVLTPEEVVIAIAVTSAGTFVTRMAVVIFGWRAPPFRWPAR
jgi:polar amino acid transport system substrate-binding protein